MAGLKEQAIWENEIYQIEENDPVHGGEEGITNKPAKQLANRTLYLRNLLTLAGQKIVPKTITATSTNTVDATGHSHEIAHGSTTQKGIVQTTSDTGLDSEELAFNAKGAKKLAQQIARNQQEIAGLKGGKVDKTAISSAVNSTSQTNVASSQAVKTAYDLAASKQSPATTLAGYGITNAMRVDTDNKNINLTTLLGQNTVWGTAGRERSVIGLLSDIYNYGVGLSISASGGKAHIYVPHSSANDNKGVWVMSAFAGNGAAPVWRRIDGTDWDAIRNPVNASTKVKGLAQYSDDINLDSSDFAATSKAVKLLNDKKLDKLVQQTIDLTRLDPNKWYPVVFRMSDIRKIHHFAVRRTLDDGNNPPWGTHGGGFTAYCEWETQPSQWGGYPSYESMRLIRQFTFAYCHQSPILKIGQISQANQEYIYLRGGTSYTLSRESDVIVDIGVNGYTWQYSHYSANLPIIERYDESLVPKTSRQVLQDAIDTKVQDNRSNVRNLNSLLGSQCFMTDGSATGIPSGWPRDHDYNGIQADGGEQRFQVLVANQYMAGLRVNDSNGDATSWTEWAEFMMSDHFVGQVAYFAMSTPPIGWLKANGAAVSRTTYAALFDRIGTRFGAGDGRTTFNLPDLRGEFVRGWDDGRNVDAGRGFGSHQGDAIRNITGEIQAGIEEAQGNGSGAFRTKNFGRRGGTGSYGDDGFTFDASRVVPTANENRPRNIALLACIKY